MSWLEWVLLAYGAGMTLLFLIVDLAYADVRGRFDAYRRHPANRARETTTR